MSIVPKIRPITDLKKTSEISEYCHSVKEPVFITKNGKPDLVLMSVEQYEAQKFWDDIAVKLLKSEIDFAKGGQHVLTEEEFDEFMDELDREIDEQYGKEDSCVNEESA